MNLTEETLNTTNWEGEKWAQGTRPSGKSAYARPSARPRFHTPGNKFHSRWQNADIKEIHFLVFSSHKWRLSLFFLLLSFPFSPLSTIVLYADCFYHLLLATPEKEPEWFRTRFIDRKEKKKKRLIVLVRWLPRRGILLLSPLLHFTRHFTWNRIRYIQESSL